MPARYPRPHIKIDGDSGEAEVTFGDDWNAMGALWRADILQDMLHDIEEAYEKAQADMRAESSKLSDSQRRTLESILGHK